MPIQGNDIKSENHSHHGGNNMARNESTVSIYGLELGKFGGGEPGKEGRTATFVFKAGKRIVGTMKISKSIVRWYGPGKSKVIKIRVENLDRLFNNAGPLEFKGKS